MDVEQKIEAGTEVDETKQQQHFVNDHFRQNSDPFYVRYCFYDVDSFHCCVDAKKLVEFGSFPFRTFLDFFAILPDVLD